MLDIPLTPEERASDHLGRYGDIGALVRRVAARHGVTLVELIGVDRTAHVVACRVEIIRALRAKGWSQPAIGRLLQLDHTTVGHHLRKARPRRKAAA